jgi:hypothetical protein
MLEYVGMLTEAVYVACCRSNHFLIGNLVFSNVAGNGSSMIFRAMFHDTGGYRIKYIIKYTLLTMNKP